MSEINANDTVSIKLMSGEEIVARFIAALGFFLIK